MAHNLIPITFFLLNVLFISTNGARTLNSLVVDQSPQLTYHKGALLTGRISINFIFYGKFTPAQKSIATDFISSLSRYATKKHPVAHTEPSVSTWWHTLSSYYNDSSTPFPRITLGSQYSDDSYKLGKSLTDSHIAQLASLGPRRYAVNVVLTSDDVAVERFCMSRCGSHAASPRSKSGRFAYIWVGNSALQCPGQCAWPFHQPIYGPQTPPLVAPNGDVGMDGMIINLATLLAGTFTNPFGNGYFQGDKDAPLEAVTACPGVYGKGAYPGYAGDLLVDESSGASYNANGANGRKYLLPAVFNPSTLSCSTLV